MSGKESKSKGDALPLEGQKKSSSNLKQKSAIAEDLLDFASISTSTNPKVDSSVLINSSDNPTTESNSNQTKDSFSLDKFTTDIAQKTSYHDDPEMLENTRFSKGAKPYSDHELAIDLKDHMDSSRGSSLEDIHDNPEEPRTESYEDDPGQNAKE
ncbi:unnamed protein product [[Candida] boidinii]|nr:unnamed protein product [[Candida] boidinii]